MPDETSVVNNVERPKGSIWIPLLGLGVLAVGGLAWYQGSQLTAFRQEFANYQASVQRENSAIRLSVTSSETELQKALAELREEIVSTRHETSTSLATTRAAARRHADTIVGKLEKQQQEKEDQLAAELTKVKESHEEAATRISGISSEVGSVRSEVEIAKGTIQQTLTDMQRVRGDLGVMSGLIATNSKEVQMLREMGDRNIFEFTLSKSAGLQKVGDIQVALKKADLKKFRYTLDVLADDKRVEKKDRGVNEPVQFYVLSKARQPYELVVNDVGKDKVVGYLSTPKVNLTRSSSSAQ